MITNKVIAEAIGNDDLDDACLVIQEAIGQTDGGIAGMFFSGTNGETWPTASLEDRLSLIRQYIAAEMDGVSLKQFFWKDTSGSGRTPITFTGKELLDNPGLNKTELDTNGVELLADFIHTAEVGDEWHSVDNYYYIRIK